MDPFGQISWCPRDRACSHGRATSARPGVGRCCDAGPSELRPRCVLRITCARCASRGTCGATRRKLVGARSTEPNPLQKLLEAVNIKLASVISNVSGASGEAMLQASGERALGHARRSSPGKATSSPRHSWKPRTRPRGSRARICGTRSAARRAIWRALRQRVRISFCRPRRPHPPPWHDASVATTGPRLRTAARARAQHAHGARALAGL